MRPEQFNLSGAGYHASDTLNMKSWLFFKEGLIPKQEIPAVLLTGPAGSGKTFMAESFAKVVGAKFFPFQNTTGVAREDYVIDLNIEAIIKSDAANCILPGLLVKALENTRHGPTVVLIDELDKAREEIDGFSCPTDVLLPVHESSTRTSIRSGYLSLRTGRGRSLNLS